MSEAGEKREIEEAPVRAHYCSLSSSLARHCKGERGGRLLTLGFFTVEIISPGWSGLSIGWDNWWWWWGAWSVLGRLQSTTEGPSQSHCRGCWSAVRSETAVHHGTPRPWLFSLHCPLLKLINTTLFSSHHVMIKLSPAPLPHLQIL